MTCRAEETELSTLAVEANDTAIQSLFGVALKLKYCLEVLDESPDQVKPALEQIVEHIDDIIEALRSRIYDLG